MHTFGKRSSVDQRTFDGRRARVSLIHMGVSNMSASSARMTCMRVPSVFGPQCLDDRQRLPSTALPRTPRSRPSSPIAMFLPPQSKAGAVFRRSTTEAPMASVAAPPSFRATLGALPTPAQDPSMIAPPTPPPARKVDDRSIDDAPRRQKSNTGPATIVLVPLGSEDRPGYQVLMQIRRWSSMAGPFAALEVDMPLVVPELGVAPGHSATSEAVVARFFGSQPAVDLLVRTLSKVVDDGERFIVLIDKNGRHRSKVASMILEDALNMLVTPSGDRAVNAKTFDTASVRGGNQALDDRLHGMRSWVEEPWHVMRGGPKAADSRFGWSHAMNSAESWDGFVAWHTHLESRFWCLPEGHPTTAELVGRMRPRPSSAPPSEVSAYPTAGAVGGPPPAPTIVVSTPPAFRTPPVALASAFGPSPPTDLPPSAPLPVPPSAAEPREWLAPPEPTPRGSVGESMTQTPVATHNKIDPSTIVGAPRTPPGPPPAAPMATDDDDWGVGWPAAPQVETPAATEQDSPVDISGTGRIVTRKRFRWQSFEPRVELWEETLEAWGIDDRARQALYLLAQHSREGYELANDIVSKLVKKIADRMWAHNPSGFVQTATRNARHRLSDRPF